MLLKKGVVNYAPVCGLAWLIINNVINMLKHNHDIRLLTIFIFMPTGQKSKTFFDLRLK